MKYIMLVVLCQLVLWLQLVKTMAQYEAPLLDTVSTPDIECESNEECYGVCSELGINELDMMCESGKCWCRPGWHKVGMENVALRINTYDFAQDYEPDVYTA